MAIWYIIWSFGILPPILVYCTTENQATLLRTAFLFFEVGDPGIRATWIGHATVLAEVDGALILCDPIFRCVSLVVL
jgi:hypothetical protein